MKPGKNKREISKEMREEIEAFLKSGGKINEIPKGVSGNINNHNPFNLAESSKKGIDRTPLDEVVKNIEARKDKKKQPTRNKNFRRRKKLLTDDFGQPLRWIWEDQE